MKPASVLFAAIGVLIVIVLGVFVVNGEKKQTATEPPPAQATPSGTAFRLVKKTDRKLSEGDLKKAETTITKGKLSADASTLTFDQKDINLVATTGPEDDMMSFRIQGIRNPTLLIPSGAALKILFVSTDGDMVHDFLLGELQRPIANHPPTANTVGSDRMPLAENKMFSAQQMSISADADGAFSYFCSVGGHAKKGMWGTIAVGKNAASQKLPSGHDAGEPHDPASQMGM